MTMKHSYNNPQQKGFSYVEVLVATTLIAIALVPAMNALQTGIMGAHVHLALTTGYYCRLRKMEELQAEPFSNLLMEAKSAGNNSTTTSFSDVTTKKDSPCYDPASDDEDRRLRRLVYIALYDADPDPFTITDANADGDNDPYTGKTANLLWVKVMTEGSTQGLETLISR